MSDKFDMAEPMQITSDPEKRRANIDRSKENPVVKGIARLGSCRCGETSREAMSVLLMQDGKPRSGAELSRLVSYVEGLLVELALYGLAFSGKMSARWDESTGGAAFAITKAGEDYVDEMGKK